MNPPSCFHPFKSSQVFLLKESLCFLKQDSRQWYTKLEGALIFQGYSSSLNDYSLFFFKTLSGLASIIVVFVDDILITWNAKDEFLYITKCLNTEFKVKELGDIHYLLGLEILKNNKDLSSIKESSLWSF